MNRERVDPHYESVLVYCEISSQLSPPPPPPRGFLGQPFVFASFAPPISSSPGFPSSLTRYQTAKG